ncbi:MAG: hypothetical protein CL827_09310 [Crocinitomicaceae bacterium]|nr:hypothetical protein [Crocinitomicaceae bacterium]
MKKIKMAYKFQVNIKKKKAVGKGKYLEPHMSVIVEQSGVSKPERPKTQKAFEELIGHKFSFSLNMNDVEWKEI